MEASTKLEPWRKANVLAVDDQPANLVALDAVLSADFNVIRAASGHQAIAILDARKDIDVILMDVQMPIMDGFEAASRIKAMEGCADIPIVFVTAVYKEDPFVRQGYEVGAIDYFSKPFNPEILRRKVGIYASFRQKSEVLKERARQVRESEELMRASRRLSALLEDLRAGIIVTDARGRILQRNPAVAELCEDLPPDAGDPTLLGWWSADGEPLAGGPPFLRPLAEGAHSCETRVEVRGPGRQARSLLCVASPLRDVDGVGSGAVVIVHDVTERRRVERDFESRVKSLVAADAELHAV